MFQVRAKMLLVFRENVHAPHFSFPLKLQMSHFKAFIGVIGISLPFWSDLISPRLSCIKVLVWAGQRGQTPSVLMMMMVQRGSGV